MQTGLIMLEYINQLRAQRYSIEDAAVERSVLRQRCFAVVSVGGLIAALVISIFLLPTLYVWMGGERDVLPAAEEGSRWERTWIEGRWCKGTRREGSRSYPQMQVQTLPGPPTTSGLGLRPKFP